MIPVFSNLMIIGKPASGKTLLEGLLRAMSPEKLLREFHIGGLEGLDDFHLFRDLCENDDIWEALGQKRRYTKSLGYGYYVADPELVLTGFLSRKIAKKLAAKKRNEPHFYDEHTLLIEFSRGGRNAYNTLLKALDNEVLKATAICYLKTSVDASIRRNNARFEEDKKHSPNSHKLPDEELHGYFATDDWDVLTEKRPDGHIQINGVNLPFVTIDNESDITNPLERFGPALKKLWELYSTK